MNALINEIIRRFHKVDQDILKFKTAVGISCPVKCGDCCRSNQVETSIVEMLPIAAQIFDNGMESFWIDRVVSAFDTGTCILYDPISENRNGCCLFYSRRPTICRLFGFSGRRDKYGNIEPIFCRQLKKAAADTCRSAKNLIAGGAIIIPVISDYALSMINLCGSESFRLYPINQALRMALQQLGLQFQLSANVRPDTPVFPIAA